MSFNQRMILLADKLGVPTCQIKYMVHYDSLRENQLFQWLDESSI